MQDFRLKMEKRRRGQRRREEGHICAWVVGRGVWVRVIGHDVLVNENTIEALTVCQHSQ